MAKGKRYKYKLRDLEAVTERFNFPCSLTSAKTGENVEESFGRLAEMILLKKTEKGQMLPTKIY